MKNKGTRALMLSLVGGYILYTAYHLLENLLAGMNDIPRSVAVGAIVLFFLAGLGVLAYAWKTWRDAKKDDGKENDAEDRLK